MFVMILQCLNGKQLEYNVDTGLNILDHILLHEEELDLDITFISQVMLTQSESDPDLCYIFIRKVSDLTFDEMSQNVSLLCDRDERVKMISLYIQKMADERELNFSATRGRYYEIYDKELSKCLSKVYSQKWWNEWDFTHPQAYVSRLLESEEEGKIVHNHWIRVNGEHFALSTLVHEEDLD